MTFDETYHDHHQTRVRLHCDGPDCWADIRVPLPCSRCDCRSESLPVDLDFLLQPRDSAQRPAGVLLLLYTQHCQLVCDQATRVFHAWTWLPPNLTPELLQRCHLRMRRPTLSKSCCQCE